MYAMKPFGLILLIAAGTAALAQTPAKPPIAAPAAKTATAAKPITAGNPGTAVPPWIKLPPGVPHARGFVKSAFTLRYQDIKIGTGDDAEPNKIYKVLYTGWLAADGHEFDSSNDHRPPLKDKDGKPILGDDGKPKLDEPQPIPVPQGFGRVIPGFDQGFYGMKVGGKRRLFIPWQLAYGAKGRPGPDAQHPGIPPKADLIFDVELVSVSDLPTPQNRQGMPQGMPGGIRMPPPRNPGAPPAANGKPATPGTPATPSAPGAPSTPPPANAPATPAAPGTPATPPPAKPPSN
jgi:peptidylprolyl isomerase